MWGMFWVILFIRMLCVFGNYKRKKKCNESDKNKFCWLYLEFIKNIKSIYFIIKFEWIKGYDIDISGCMFDVLLNSGFIVVRLLVVFVLIFDW